MNNQATADRRRLGLALDRVAGVIADRPEAVVILEPIGRSLIGLQVNWYK